MSNYYRLHCIDCGDSDSPSEASNHAGQQMVVWLQPEARAAMVAVHAASKLQDFPHLLAEHEHVPDPGWMAEHSGHCVVVMSEWGDHYYGADGAVVEPGRD